MKSLVVFFFLFAALLYGATSTSKQIKKSKTEISKTDKKRKQTTRQLDKIARDIKNTEKSIAKLEKKLDLLGKDQVKTEEEYQRLKEEYRKSTKDFEVTSEALKKKSQQFISLLSEQFSIVFAMEQAHAPTRESVMAQEVYKAYKEQNTKMLASLKRDILRLKKQKEDKQYQRNRTKNRIARIVKKRELYAKQKQEKEKLLKKLSADEGKYTAKLQEIVDAQNSLRATLAKLNILHKQEVEEARRQAAARKKAMQLEKERKARMRKEAALAKAKAKKAKEALKRAKTEKAKKAAILASKQADKEVETVKKRAYKQSERVRTVNSSYHRSKVYKYRGGKTISPLKGARVIKKFGTYVDPIYKIKIFNESITLQASSTKKVQNVLNGKVVFAGKSSMLGRVVVVAHSGKIHTVYAGLSKIAPNIKTGRKIKRGYVIGKVHSKLLFQATKNSKHIDPLKLIKL